MRTFLIWGMATVLCALVVGAVMWAAEVTLISTNPRDDSTVASLVISSAVGLVAGIFAGFFPARPVRAFGLLLAMAITVAALLSLSQLVLGRGKFAAIAALAMGIYTGMLAATYGLGLAIGLFIGMAVRRHW